MQLDDQDQVFLMDDSDDAFAFESSDEDNSSCCDATFERNNLFANDTSVAERFQLEFGHLHAEIEKVKL